jgi:hypothetical protein
MSKLFERTVSSPHNLTRDLCRDSSTTSKSTDSTASHCKYIIGIVIVYRDVYREASRKRIETG